MLAITSEKALKQAQKQIMDAEREQSIARLKGQVLTADQALQKSLGQQKELSSVVLLESAGLYDHGLIEISGWC